MTAAPNRDDDPALAMCVQWQRDRDQYDDLLYLASQRECDVFAAAPELQAEAQRLYEAAANASDRVGDQLERATRAIFRTKAQTLEGALAKLAVAIRHCAPSPRSDQEPWPYLRNVHADFERLHAANANDRAGTAQGGEPRG
jgi:primosomal protein N''